MNEEKPLITLPQLCPKHQTQLVKDTKYGPNDAWRALMIASQIALFQAGSVTVSVQKKLDGNIELMSTLGCLACRLPHRFEQIIREGRSHDLGKIKNLGERWVKEAKERKE